jgi:hypothetical protein
MYTFVSQDLVTMRGPSSAVITQGNSAWLDLAEFQDVVAWLEVLELTTAQYVNISYQTAPTADDSLFVPISGPLMTMPFNIATVVTITPLLKELLGVPPLSSPLGAPLARWFRWQLIGGPTAGTWDVTFRLFVSANCLRKRSRKRP